MGAVASGTGEAAKYGGFLSYLKLEHVHQIELARLGAPQNLCLKGLLAFPKQCMLRRQQCKGGGVRLAAATILDGGGAVFQHLNAVRRGARAGRSLHDRLLSSGVEQAE